MGIGGNIKKLIDERNMTVNEVAKMANIAPQTLYAIIKRDKEGQKVSPNILSEIAEVLNVDVYALIGTTRHGAYNSTFFKKEFLDGFSDITWDYSGEKQDYETKEKVYEYERQQCAEKYENYIQPILNSLGYSSELILSLSDFVILLSKNDVKYILPFSVVNRYIQNFTSEISECIKTSGIIATNEIINHLKEGQKIYSTLGDETINDIE